MSCLSLPETTGFSRTLPLYHGAISNCQTDAGWLMVHGEEEVSIVKEFDYAINNGMGAAALVLEVAKSVVSQRLSLME